MKDKQDYVSHVSLRIFLNIEYFRIYTKKIAIICFLLSYITFKRSNSGQQLPQKKPNYRAGFNMTVLLNSLMYVSVEAYCNFSHFVRQDDKAPSTFPPFSSNSWLGSQRGRSTFLMSCCPNLFPFLTSMSVTQHQWVHPVPITCIIQEVLSNHVHASVNPVTSVSLHVPH